MTTVNLDIDQPFVVTLTDADGAPVAMGGTKSLTVAGTAISAAAPTSTTSNSATWAQSLSAGTYMATVACTVDGLPAVLTYAWVVGDALAAFAARCTVTVADTPNGDGGFGVYVTAPDGWTADDLPPGFYDVLLACTYTDGTDSLIPLLTGATGVWVISL